MLTAILLLFLAAVFFPAACRRAGRGSGWLLSAAPLGFLLFLAASAPEVWRGGVVSSATPWAPSLGLVLSFRLDGLSLLFALLIAGVGAIVVVYSGEYLAGHPHLGRYFRALLLFMASMLGLVLADNMLVLFVFWELTSITSYLLIGFEHEREAARRGALQALLVTGSGGLALLAGLVMVGQIAGTYQISALIEHGEALRSHELYPAALLLVLLGAFTKSAQFPFHFWLPNAMEAPTPASAYLHAATMVKAGIYLLARLTPALGGTDLWFWAVTLTGAATMLLAAWLALGKSDLKQILAYSTVSVLGLLVFLLGIGGEHAWTAMLAYLMAHALYKGSLFLVAGIVDHETGTRDIGRLGGLRSAMPFTAAAAFAAAASMAGLPPSLGFVGKELALDSIASAPALQWLLAAVVVATAALLFVASGMVSLRPFLGAAGDPPKQPSEGPPALWMGPAALAAAGLGFGVAPGLLNVPLGAAARVVAGAPLAPLDLALFHGFNLPLLLSAVSVAAGLVLYRLQRRAAPLGASLRWGPERWYGAAFDGMMSLARLQTRVLQNGYLRYYILTMVLTTVALTGYALSDMPVLAVRWSFDVQAHEALLVGVILAAAVLAVRSRSGFTSVAALGVIGIGIALIFVLYGAPDLAITQVVVDMLTVILLVLVLHRLPEKALRPRGSGRFRDRLAALSAGGLIAVLVAITTTIDHPASAARFFIENSVAAGGRNVVNVILVDFRALDTLGEITVLAVAAVGVYAVRRLRASHGSSL